MEDTGPCKCPCGYDAGGDLRVATQDFTGRLIVTEDAGPDDYHFCPRCDRELLAENVVARDAVECAFDYGYLGGVTVDGHLSLALAVDDAIVEAWTPLRERLAKGEAA